jgi:hypothetical protein
MADITLRVDARLQGRRLDQASTPSQADLGRVGHIDRSVSERRGAGPCRRHNIPCEERDLSLTGFYRAEMFCTGTTGELAPFIKVDGRSIGAATMGLSLAAFVSCSASWQRPKE